MDAFKKFMQAFIITLLVILWFYWAGYCITYAFLTHRQYSTWKAMGGEGGWMAFMRYRRNPRPSYSSGNRYQYYFNFDDWMGFTFGEERYRGTAPSTPEYHVNEALMFFRASTWEEAKASYRKMARQHHPDQFSDPARKADAEATMKVINAHYDVLKRHYANV